MDDKPANNAAAFADMLVKTTNRVLEQNAEIESLRQQLAHAETNVAAQAEMLEKVIRERDEYLRDLGAMKNWIADWHKKDTELATVTAERDELVAALDEIRRTHYPAGVLAIADAALAKLGADKTGEVG